MVPVNKHRQLEFAPVSTHRFERCTEFALELRSGRCREADGLSRRLKHARRLVPIQGRALLLRHLFSRILCERTVCMNHANPCEEIDRQPEQHIECLAPNASVA